MNKIFVFILCAFVLAACGGGREQKRDAVAAERLKAAQLSEKAAEAYEKGANELALKYYREALRLSRSIEDFDSMAIGALNTAAALRATGRLGEAEGLIDKLLQAPYMRMSRRVEAEARYLKALILMDRKDAAGAARQAGLAIKKCEKGCDAMAHIYNLSARANMESGDNSTARKQALAGTRAGHKDGDKREEANALRLLGELDEKAGTYEKAAEYFDRALELDKGLALGPKIYFDLMGLGNVSVKLNDQAKAVEYYSRALSVAEALGDRDKTAQAQDGLAAVQKNK